MSDLLNQQWQHLCKRQLDRAMHGDQKAAAWCAEHAPHASSNWPMAWPEVDRRALLDALSKSANLADLRLHLGFDFAGLTLDQMLELRRRIQQETGTVPDPRAMTDAEIDAYIAKLKAAQADTQRNEKIEVSRLDGG